MAVAQDGYSARNPVAQHAHKWADKEGKTFPPQRNDLQPAHLSQPKISFRAKKMLFLNKAIAGIKARGDASLFIDGDWRGNQPYAQSIMARCHNSSLIREI